MGIVAHGLDQFLAGEHRMYSPKIPERLIPPLYRLARPRGQPMTKIVAEALEAYLASQGIAAETGDASGDRAAADHSDALRRAA